MNILCGARSTRSLSRICQNSARYSMFAITPFIRGSKQCHLEEFHKTQWRTLCMSFIYLFIIGTVGHYNCLIDSNNQVIHKLSTQGSLFISKITTHYIWSIPKATYSCSKRSYTNHTCSNELKFWIKSQESDLPIADLKD